MGTGQIISDTFGIVKDRFGSLLGLWAIYFGITMVLFFILAAGIGATGLVGLATLGEDSALAAGAGMILLVVLFYLGYLLVAMAQYASLVRMASPVSSTTFGEALGAGWRAAPALVLLMIVLLVGYFAVALVMGLVGAVLSALGDWGSALFAVLLLPVLIWLACRLSPLFAVVAVDDVRNPFKAIARAWRLTEGHALTILLASLVFIVILAVVCGVLLLPSFGLLSSLSDPSGLASTGPAVGGFLLLGLGALVASVLLNLSYCAFLAVVHGTLAGTSGENAAEVFA